MVTFLERTYPDGNNAHQTALGVHFRQRHHPGNDLPLAQNGERYLPYALTAAGDVVYAPSSSQGWNEGNGLTRYSSRVSKERRRLADAALGMHGLDPQFTREAVNAVSRGLSRELHRQLYLNPDLSKQVVKDRIGRYYFNTNKKNFGRIEEVNVATKSAEQVWYELINTLRDGTVDQKLSIHDTVGTKLLRYMSTAKQTAYRGVDGNNHITGHPMPAGTPGIREAWMNNPPTRGRTHRDAPPVVTGGVARAGAPVPNTQMDRKRGVDMFSRDPGRVRSAGGDRYFKALDSHNLIFGASISGTTGTLLQSGIAFGGLHGELLQQYLFAILGYLVGGGMHVGHESLEVARRLGVPYVYGQYEPSLPQTFRNSREYARWREEYYDVAVLGGTHWRYNNVAGEQRNMGHHQMAMAKQRLEQTLRFRPPQPANPVADQRWRVMRQLVG